MYVYDRQLSDPKDQRREQLITLRPSDIYTYKKLLPARVLMSPWEMTEHMGIFPGPIVAPSIPDTPVVNHLIPAHTNRRCSPGDSKYNACKGMKVLPERRRAIERIVIHTLGVPSRPGSSGVRRQMIGWQGSGDKSAHYLVDRDGTIIQM